MTGNAKFILGEYQRTLDERFRLSIPTEMSDVLTSESNVCILAKERPGCLSLWDASQWDEKMKEGIELIEKKMHAGRLEGRIDEVQMLGRLLSTRHKSISLAGRGRLVIPEGFRSFLGVEPGEEVTIVGAAVCVELWHPTHWLNYLEGRMPEFRQIFDQLSQ
ncbi:MAG: division/cell wall cluster transcriptional repressor MraZ [Planctomycetia bacterium]|nr:division/cell wall cluster transcriptional repressor MraZ [Planctomycetia bacterium]